MVIAEKPSPIKFSSVVSRFKVPEAPARPIVVDAVLGAMVKVLVPLIAPPMLMASVVRVRLLLLAETVEPVVISEADKVVAVATVTAPV
jgi:hypothetical protein